MDAYRLIEKYYAKQSALRDLLTLHSESVMRKAMDCLERRGIVCDREFVREAALLHDIGIIRTHAPSILCVGDRPYICHGIEGRAILDAENLPRHALVCERHTGAGLSKEDIISQNLPLPHRDMLPLSVEERVICYADKFFSKSGDARREKPLDEVIRSMERHGAGTLERFMQLHSEFGV